MPHWLTSVGMEVHVELNTLSKMFCRCPVEFGGAPNTRTCPVCLGLPGALPVPNKSAVEKVLQTALALNCEIAYDSIFHRKNYFYPDLPKGFQISQYGETNPLGYKGYLDIPAKNGDTKRINIRRVHLEEDTGKLIHLPGGSSGVDFNRSGTPLMEIVTDFPPDIETAEEAKEYLAQLRAILLYLNVSDCKMEEGSMRCEPNISVRPEGAQELGTKTEIKNLNSFRSVQLGIEHEVRRQIALHESGGKVLQETRGWSEERLETFPQRLKEFENDYRYFPDPDLVPMHFEEQDVELMKGDLPELPLVKSRRYQQELGLSSYDANLLTSDLDWSEFFENVIAEGADPKTACNWMNSDFAMLLNAEGTEAKHSKISPLHLQDLIRLLDAGQISGKIAKDVFKTAYETGRMPSEIVDESGISQISNSSEIEEICRKVISGHSEVVSKYKGGQAGVIGFLIGQAMKETQGRANPQIVQETMRRLIEE